jgi:hypothetical protein
VAAAPRRQRPQRFIQEAGRKPTCNLLAEENQKLKAQAARLKKLQQAEIIIDVKKVSALMRITLPETDRD